MSHRRKRSKSTENVAPPGNVKIYGKCRTVAGKCRTVRKRQNLRKMSHRRREMLQSAENVVNPTAGKYRIVDGKCRKKIAAGICRNIDGKCSNYY